MAGARSSRRSVPATDSLTPAAARGFRRYRPVWSVRPLRWTFAGVLTARLGQTMMPLALLLLFHQHSGGFALAGAAVAVYGITWAAAGPVVARIAARHGAGGMLAAGMASAAGIAWLAVTASPVMTWIALVVAGASTPPLTATLRAAIVTCLPSASDRTAAFSLDAIGTEVLFICGPALVAVAVAVGTPSDALLLAAGLLLAGTITTALTARGQLRPATPGPARHVTAGLASRLGPWLVIAAIQMAAIGFIEVGVTGRAVQLGHPAAAGTVLSIWAAGSAIGGLVFGTRDWPGRTDAQLAVLLLLVATGFAVTAAAQTLPWLYLVMFVAGLSCAPAATSLATSFSQAGQAAHQTENFAWLESSAELGGSAGYAAAGLLLAHSGIIITLLTGAALPIAAAAGVIRQGHMVRHNRRVTSRSGP